MTLLTNEQMPSILNDPFKKVSIKAIRVHYSESSFTKGKWLASGTVSFKNGNTSGEQEFKGTDFNDVVIQIKQFIGNLDK